MKKGKKVALITLKMFKQRTVLAYERAWAIDAGSFAQPEEDKEIYDMIRKIIPEKNTTYAKNVKIVYDGSIPLDNAEAMLPMENIDGALFGCCSINPSGFTKICEIADRFKCGDMAK